MKIILESKELREIAQLIADATSESGTLYYNAYGVEISVEYSKDVHGTQDTDYLNGTGEFMIESADVLVDDLYVDDENVEVVYDDDLLCEHAESIIMEA